MTDESELTPEGEHLLNVAGKGIVATGGWCSPLEQEYKPLPFIEGDVIGDFEAEVTVRRGGMAFTAFNPPPPLTPEERAEQERLREQARAERKAAGGEWCYAIRETDAEDGGVTIHDGSSPWGDYDRHYSSAEEAIEAQSYQFNDGNTYEVVRRWIADPPEWEQFTIETEEKS